MTEFLIVVAVIDLMVFVGLYSVMKAGRAHDRTSEAQARALWASNERVRRETPLGGASRGSAQSPFAGRRVVDSHGSMLGTAGDLLVDPFDGSARWLEVQVRGLGARRYALVPAEGVGLGMNEVRVPVARDDVLRSPVMLSPPLTRESELMLCRHYGLSRRAGELYGRAAGEVTIATAAQSVVA